MNRQRKVVITITYNEMGIIIDTKAEEVPQSNLQPTCNQLATDTISRQAAIDAFGLSERTRKYGGDHSGYDTRMLYEIQDILEGLPPAEPEYNTDEWCHDCKEYDQERHCCPRWNRLIRRTINEFQSAYTRELKVLANVLDGCPLTHPCEKLWSLEGWCKDHCNAGRVDPDAECWLKYAEVVANETD